LNPQPNAVVLGFPSNGGGDQSGAEGGVRAVYGVYVLADRTVWAPRCGSDEVTGLASPPADARGFVEFGDNVIRSQRIAALLGR